MARLECRYTDAYQWQAAYPPRSSFPGDRTDRMFPYLPYDRLPGQWGGIRFYKTSYENHLVYADIHGGSFGIRCDSSMTDRRKLTLESSIIRQVSGNGLELTSCQAVVRNSEISNAGENCVSLLGEIIHSLTVRWLIISVGTYGKGRHCKSGMNRMTWPIRFHQLSSATVSLQVRVRMKSTEDAPRMRI